MSALLGLGIAGLASGLLASGLQQANYNRQMNMAQSQYDDMRNRQDPVTQVNRLRAAGINPALAYGNVNLGQASSTSVPSSPSFSGLDLNGLSAIGNGLDLNSIIAKNYDSSTQKNVAEAEGITTDNLFRAENWKSLIYGRDTQSWLNDKLSQAAKLDVAFKTDTLKFRVEQQRQQMALLQSQVAAQDLSNHYFPFEKSEQISKLLSEQFANYATGKASLHQVHLNMMRLFAEVGSNPKERSEFFNASLAELQARKRSLDRVQTPFSAGPTGVRYDNVYTYNDKTGEYDRR